MTNRVVLCGRIISRPVIIDTVYPSGNIFFMMDISPQEDESQVVRVVISQKIYKEASKVKEGDVIYLKGLFSSKIIPGDGRAQKFLYVFAIELKVMKCYHYFKNHVVLTGTIGEDMHFGSSKIDFTLKVIIPRCNTSFIPCVIKDEKLINRIRNGEITKYDITYKVLGYINSRSYVDNKKKLKNAYEIVISYFGEM